MNTDQTTTTSIESRQVMPVAERRQLLINAAKRVMKRSGLASATTRAITAEAGMSQGSFHYAFRSKHELITEIMKSEVPDNLESVWGDIDYNSGVEYGLHKLLSYYWSHVEDDWNEQLVLSELAAYALRNPDLSNISAEIQDYYQRFLAEVLERLAEQTNTRWDTDTALLSGVLLSVLQGLTVIWLSNRDDRAARQILSCHVKDIAKHATPVNTYRYSS